MSTCTTLPRVMAVETKACMSDLAVSRLKHSGGIAAMISLVLGTCLCFE